jgi:threonine/homoserine efflux transporter RhtA
VQSLIPMLTAVFGMMLPHEQLRMGQWLGLAGVGLVVGEAAGEIELFAGTETSVPVRRNEDQN